MLDECKGDRLDEVLAVFSNAVLKKVLLEGESVEHQALAQQLALENFSYTGERSILSALIIAHKASLSKFLREKEGARAGYLDFSALLSLNDRRIARRHEQLKEVIEVQGSKGQISPKDMTALQELVQQNWSGNPEWLESILYGDSRAHAEGLLATPFDKLWRHVENGTIGEVEERAQTGLLEQLDNRVRDQKARLAKWEDFSKTLSKVQGTSPTKPTNSALAERKRIDLGFNQHQSLQIGRSAPGTSSRPAVSLEEYTRLVENMKSELAEVGKPQAQSKRPARQSLVPGNRRVSVVASQPPKEDSPSAKDGEWSSASDTDEISPGSIDYATKSTSRTPPSEPPILRKEQLSDIQSVDESVLQPLKDEPSHPTRPSVLPNKELSPTPERLVRTPSPMDPPIDTKPMESEADQILNSMSAASPSPKKPRHTLSLAERTRLSMARASHSEYSDLHDDFEIADLPRLSIKPRPSMAPKIPSAEAEPGKHADLIERTRKSMAGFEVAQKKAQMDRRKSVKDAKKKQRESSYFPKVEEEVVTPDVSAIELLEGDPDYESVFKSRPKIKTSPAVSPTRIWEDQDED
jgi:hypothetical protein